MSNHKLAVSRGLSPLNKPTSALTTHATRNAATPNAASMTKLLTDLTQSQRRAQPQMPLNLCLGDSACSPSLHRRVGEST